MANKWKYASLNAEERIDRIRSGDKDVYDSEIARSMDVIRSRNELGLDITDQKKWIDRVNYNYNLASAARVGVDAANVSRSGYADRLLGTERKTDSHAPVTLTSKNADRLHKANTYLNEFYDKAKAANEEIAVTKEWLVNNGIDADSVDGKRILADAKSKIDAQIEKYRTEFFRKVKSL